MEHFDMPYGKEYVRMAILKHEETFKEQVYELHRLYRVQKILMRNTACNKPVNAQTPELGSSENGFSFNQKNRAYNLHQDSMVNFDLERPAGVQNVADSSGNGAVESYTDENEVELTLGPTNYYNPRKKPEINMTCDSTPSFSSSSTGSSDINMTSSINHPKTNKRREELTHHSFGFAQVSDVTLGYQIGSKNSFVHEQQLRQEKLKQPPRLFQLLSLNTT